MVERDDTGLQGQFEDVKEAPQKWVCQECLEVTDSPLFANNPFDPSSTVTGCPVCRSANTLTQACQVSGCKNQASGGYPNHYGFKYIFACHEHSPYSVSKTKG